MVKNPLAKQEAWVQSLGQEDPLRRNGMRRNDDPLQYSCLEDSVDIGAWRVHGVAKELDMT